MAGSEMALKLQSSLFNSTEWYDIVWFYYAQGKKTEMSSELAYVVHNVNDDNGQTNSKTSGTVSGSVKHIYASM